MTYDMNAALAALKDAPADTGRVKPKQWCVGVIEKVEVRANTFIDPPVDEINATVRLTDYDGNKRGVEFLTIFAPPKGHPQFTEPGTDRYNKRGNFKLGQYKKAMHVIVAPQVSYKDSDPVIAAAWQAAGSVEAAMLHQTTGRTQLFKIGIDNGLDKDGTIDPATGEVKIVNQKRHANPRNEITTVIPDTETNRSKYNAESIAKEEAAFAAKVAANKAALGSGTAAAAGDADEIPF